MHMDPVRLYYHGSRTVIIMDHVQLSLKVMSVSGTSLFYGMEQNKIAH
jgi:hypothetical protein